MTPGCEISVVAGKPLDRRKHDLVARVVVIGLGAVVPDERWHAFEERLELRAVDLGNCHDIVCYGIIACGKPVDLVGVEDRKTAQQPPRPAVFALAGKRAVTLTRVPRRNRLVEYGV